MDTNLLYPYTFRPLLKPIVWGGQAIRRFKGMEQTSETIGESWEISHVKGSYSIIEKGPLAGKSIDDLIKCYGDKLLGKHVYERFENRFPLLIKFIDARDNLSVQVHPNDTLAAQRHNSFGKTEMWYVVHADSGAHLFSGFSQQSSPEDYERRIADNSIMEVLSEHEVHDGDVFFLPAGRIHAIGAGCFIAEIQQTSDITYRIYDYNRPGQDGQKRELHTDLAKDAIDYQLQDSYKTAYPHQSNHPIQLVKCPYFKTNLLEITQPISRNLLSEDSFIIYICTKGELSIKDRSGISVQLKQGQTVLVPAKTADIELTPNGISSCTLLETFIPSV